MDINGCKLLLDYKTFSKCPLDNGMNELYCVSTLQSIHNLGVTN